MLSSHSLFIFSSFILTQPTRRYPTQSIHPSTYSTTVLHSSEITFFQLFFFLNAFLVLRIRSSTFSSLLRTSSVHLQRLAFYLAFCALVVTSHYANMQIHPYHAFLSSVFNGSYSTFFCSARSYITYGMRDDAPV